MNYREWQRDTRHRRRITRDDVQDWLFLALLVAFVLVSMFAWGGPNGN